MVLHFSSHFFLEDWQNCFFYAVSLKFSLEKEKKKKEILRIYDFEISRAFFFIPVGISVHLILRGFNSLFGTNLSFSIRNWFSRDSSRSHISFAVIEYYFTSPVQVFCYVAPFSCFQSDNLVVFCFRRHVCLQTCYRRMK